MKGQTRQSFMGVGKGNSVTIRDRDQTITNYSIGWGTTIPNDPYIKDIQAADWDTIEKVEQEWLTNKGCI